VLSNRRVLILWRTIAGPIPGARRPTIPFGAAALFYWAALYIYVPILPVYAEALGASFTMIGLIVAAYGVGQLVLRLPIGLASDWWGRRKPFCVAGLLIASVGCAVLLAAPDPAWLVIGRGIVGVSAAAWVTLTVMYSDWFSPEHAPAAMAWLTVLSGIAQMASTISGGWLADTLGWQAPFIMGAGFGLLGAVLLLGIPEEQRARRADPRWSRLLAVCTAPRLLIVSIVGALIQYAFWATTYAFVPVYAHHLGASRTVLGLLASGALVSYTVAALAVSRWITRWDAVRTTMIGLALQAASAAVVPLLHDLLALGLSQAVGGIGRGLAMPTLLGLSIQTASSSEKATAMGVFQAVYAVGMVLGPASAGVVAEALGLTIAFLFSALMCLTGLVLLAIAKRRDASSR
jgi:MFS family permease